MKENALSDCNVINGRKIVDFVASPAHHLRGEDAPFRRR